MIKLEEQLAGWYKIEAVKADGSRRVLADWFPNLITDGGLERIATNSDCLAFCQVGSGSTTPLVTDTALASRVAARQWISGDGGISGAQSTVPYYGFRRLTYKFPQGAAAGNLSEVGVGWSGTGNLFSRALILDTAGNPTTITVLADEFLDVTYEFRRYPGTADITGTVVLAGVTYGWVSRACRVTDAGSWGMQTVQLGGGMASPGVPIFRTGGIGPITSGPSGTAGGGSISTKAYSANSRVIEFVVTASLVDANFNIGSLEITGALFADGCYNYQFGFTPAIPKDNTKILTLGVKHSWARKTL